MQIDYTYIPACMKIDVSRCVDMIILYCIEYKTRSHDFISQSTTRAFDFKFTWTNCPIRNESNAITHYVFYGETF